MKLSEIHENLVYDGYGWTENPKQPKKTDIDIKRAKQFKLKNKKPTEKK